MKIVHVRLINGDEVIGQLSAKNQSTITLLETLVVDEIKNNDTGTSTIFLSKYTLCDEKTLDLRKDHVVTLTSVSAEVEDYYKNSVEYSKNYVEPNKRAEIAKVSAVLAGMNKSESDLIVLKSASSDSYRTMSSNTTH